LIRKRPLARVEAGDSEGAEMYAVERFPTVLQMTSTVVSELEGGVGPVELLHATFPAAR
jgi:anthranilate/para-aminobenzoate synthase component I